eukprot:CAMPEP_0177343190 /NCGR_PEP_ID=MMETSP0368-20130122/27444_1 /TAXON_ID=447022 ORGANISM="Scrippsiella hangoei-like, Strain SHHI-4" /NCGR_SAMPLE_ID=MMETSP0368 /ASSEMBLY_ACC=CAM_ASM_000363 /LENGTH=575 /DNA_ID=CAMNT_0018804607 /DNA_START=31 /DNA_END=1758 /DNA_ORIENTATION=-
MEEGDSVKRWSELLVKAAQTRVQKKRAVADEDFAEASRLKKQEKALAPELESAQNAAAAGGSVGGASEEREKLEQSKKRAIEDEDFAEAGRLKKRIKLLDEPGGSSEEVAKRAWTIAVELAALAGGEEASALVQELKTSAPAGTFEGVVAAPAPAAAALRTAARTPLAGLGAGAGVAAAAAVKHEAGDFIKVKSEAPSTCSVPGLSVQQLLKMPNQDIWQKAWEVTWQKADATGQAEDQKAVYAQAQKVWKGWLAERDRLAKSAAAAPKTEPKVEAEADLRAASADSRDSGGLLSEEQRRSQEKHWRDSRTAEADWKRAVSEADKKKRFNEGGGGGEDEQGSLHVAQDALPGRPAHPLRALVGCLPHEDERTAARAGDVEGAAGVPPELRGQRILRPALQLALLGLASRAAEYDATGVQDDACLPESMLTVAKQIFEERLRPMGQAAEDPLAQFLAQPGRIPPDTPMPFAELLSRCPPGTEPMELVRTMAKRRDVYRQDASGSLFCVRPRGRCKDWGAVNPYADPTALPTTGAKAGIARGGGLPSAGGGRTGGHLGGSSVVGGPMLSATEGGGEE